jgi:capsular exopolysaccharide synthesis family protein
MLFITSTNAGEGKSTIALNLAQAFASDEKVLIIDADLRKPNLHRGMGKNGNGSSTGKKTGLSNYLTGTGANVVQESGLPNLKVVYAGPIPPNPSELLSSNRMRQFLAEVYEDYDRIIIDGPPAMGFADALILGHYADGVILVSVLGETHREALRVFRRTLENVGGRMIGTIVNKLNQGRAAHTGATTSITGITVTRRLTGSPSPLICFRAANASIVWRAWVTNIQTECSGKQTL